jgi:hypothetical protein
MKKRVCLVLFLGLINTFCFAQQREKIFYKETQIETADYNLIVVDAVANPVETKFKLKIVNKTASYLSYNPLESKFIINNVEYMVVSEKPLMIEPYKTESKVINLKGAYNTAKTYSFVVSGIYKLSANVLNFAGDDYKLPPSANTVNVGPYTVAIEKLNKETNKTIVKFNCIYNGEKTGLVHPMRISVKMPDGKEYATIKKERPILLLKGQADNFAVVWERMPGGKENDMQLVEMMLKWNATYTEADKEKTPDSTFILNIDEVKTNK